MTKYTSRKSIRAATVVVCLATLGACEARIDTHGFMPNPELIEQIEPGVSDRNEIAAVLGTPSAPSTFDDDIWYYITQRTRNFAFFKPEIIDQRILVVEFDDSNTVKEVRELGLEEAYWVDPVDRITPTVGNELSFLQQVFGNIGRFAKDPGP